eukprot:GEMP01074919.1.p1 GENE.GEMP01074919.1~~GEMP01074919.1.p1  ORF type:complete len:241 (+),score=36.26 GEMP01074919.1:26-724(+)
MSIQPIIVVCGPSGAGKSTLIKRLLKERPSAFAFSVSHTTRDPRPGEINGLDYHFVSKDYMRDAIKANQFVEFAEVHKNFYGTSFKAVHDIIHDEIAPKRCILDIDVQGAENVKKSVVNKDTYYLYISPPSIEDLETRLRSRGTETEQSLSTRLANAKHELLFRDIPGFWDTVIINDNLDAAYEQFRAVLISQPCEVHGNDSELVDDTDAGENLAYHTANLCMPKAQSTIHA